MKVEKIIVYRIVAHISCGCSASREYRDEVCKEPLVDTIFVPCGKHKGKGDATGMAQMLLTERIEEEAEKAAEVAVALAEKVDVAAKAAKLRQVRASAGVPEPVPEDPDPDDPGGIDETQTSTQPGGSVTRIPLRAAPGAGRSTIRPAGAGGTIQLDARKAQAIRNTQIVTGERRAAPAVPTQPRPAVPQPVRTAAAPVRPVPGNGVARTGPVKFQRPTAPTPAPQRGGASGPQSSDVQETAERLEHAQSTNLLDSFLEVGGGEQSEG